MRQSKLISKGLSIFLIGGLVLSGCGPRSRKTNNTSQKKDPHITVKADLSNVRPFQMDEKGRLLWEAHAKSLEVREVDRAGDLNDVQVTLYQEGKPEIIVTAPKMHADYKTRELRLIGGIKAVSKRQQAQFVADTMTWNAGTNHFVGKKGVRLIKGNTVVTGGVISGDTRLKKVDISDNPRVIVK
jgi:LPS export ABC transporter protein LptC